MQPTRACSYREGTGRFLLAWFDAVPREQFPEAVERLARDRPGRECLAAAYAGSIAASPHDPTALAHPVGGSRSRARRREPPLSDRVAS